MSSSSPAYVAAPSVNAGTGVVDGYVALSYHYIRRKVKGDPYARIIANDTDDFVEQVRAMRAAFRPVALDDARALHGETGEGTGATGVLLTFDDGLSDHYEAAAILAEHGIRGVFFIPTCVVEDELPANPIIIHYGLARFGVGRFLEAYRNGLEETGLSVGEYDVAYTKGDDPWQAIGALKSTVKYKLHHQDTRRILLSIYHNLMLPDRADMLSVMHLTREQIREMVAAGHAIGGHTHTHVSVAASKLSPEEFEAEVMRPRRLLEETFGTRVDAMSYPFGERQDCLSWERLLGRTRDYRLAFTIEPVINTPATPPLEQGRYMPHSRDTAASVLEILRGMAERKES